MPRLSAGGQTREIDLVVFDKDGTLMDFDRLWTGKLKAAIDSLMAAADGPEMLQVALSATLGLDPDAMKVVPESPLAVATLPKIGIAAAVVLHQAGYTWHEAERLCTAHFQPVIEAPPRADDVRPIGDVTGLMGRLKGAGARIAIFTSDDRLGTEVSLPMMQIDRFVEAMVCGDDPIKGKPSGDGLRHLSKHFGIAPERMLMIGDSVSDMRAARDAKLGWRLAVRSGTGDPGDLVGAADAVIDSIDGLMLD